jgi:hypothetical protein
VNSLDPEDRLHGLEQGLVGRGGQELLLKGLGHGIHGLRHVLFNNRVSGVTASLIENVFHIDDFHRGKSGGSRGGRRSIRQKVVGKVGGKVEKTPSLALLNMINQGIACPARLLRLVDPIDNVVQGTGGVHDLALNNRSKRRVVGDRLEERDQLSRCLRVIKARVGVIEDNLDIFDSGQGGPERTEVQPDVNDHDERGGCQQEPGILLQEVGQDKELGE